ncbi:hypothetical protein [Glycomyces tenuis]|uniref:hypothetical protein n=1 Tax=Glycomyces tenuis TaxID=58116 RepID=UPI0012DFDF70|nr:hypothetical protein [Glycomyces tenuis]
MYSHRISEHSIAQRHLVFLLALGALALTSACTDTSSEPGNDAGADTTVDITSEALPVPEEIEEPREAAVAAYERYWRTVAESGEVPDPNYGSLVQVASGAALETARSLAQDALDAGERATGAPSHTAEVTEAYPESNPYHFVIEDCMDSTEWIVVDAETGEPVEGEEYGTREVEALVEHIDDRWIVSEVVLRELGTCLGGPRSDRRLPLGRGS